MKGSSYIVSSLWRYPVKSMAGEELPAVNVSQRGLCGDRAYALVDNATRRVGSAKNVKRFGDLLKYRARFLSEPTDAGQAPPVHITLPDGSTLQSDRADLEALLLAIFGPNVSLASTAPEGLMLEFAAGTLGGSYATTTELPVSSGAPAGTLFNYASVHLITTSSLRGFAAAADRFRPNLIVDSGDESGFPENAWPGRVVSIGPDLLLRVSIPCPRCVITTLPRTDLPAEASMLRTIARNNTVNLGEFGDLPCAGVYADVLQPGRVQRGDSVRVLD
jgi:uncharacterized protein YcbX